MKISEKRGRELYKSISEPITEARIEAVKNGHYGSVEEKRLYRLEQQIWERVKVALNIK